MRKNTINAIISSAILVFLLVLGIGRLYLGHRETVLSAEQISMLNLCLPSAEFRPDSTVWISATPLEQTRLRPQGTQPQAKFDLVATAPIKLDKSAGAGTSADPLRLRKIDGTFELRPARGQTMFVRRDGIDFELSTASNALPRFGPADAAIYDIVATGEGAITTGKDGERTLSLAAKGTVAAEGALEVQLLQPLFLARYGGAVLPVLHPVRVSGQPGLSNVSVEVKQPGLRLDDGKVTLAACAWRARSNTWDRAAISETQSAAAGSARVLISLPEGTFPTGYDFREQVMVALASSDGRYLAIGSFEAVPRALAAAIATAVVAVLLGWLMTLRGRQLGSSTAGESRWFSGLFTGPDGDPSLSLWQIFVWTVVTVWGMLYVFLVAGSLLTVTPEVMGLLGIAGVGSVLARWIASSTGSTSQGSASSAVTASPPKPHLFWQMLSTNNSFDLLKLQLFVFTVVIAVYVVARIADAAAFPALDVNTLLLMGVSQGVYITSKAAAAGSVARAVAIKAEMDALSEQQKNLQGRKLVAEKQKEAVDQSVAKAGAEVTPEMTKQRDALAGEVADWDKQVEAAKARVASLKLDLERMVKDLGLA